MSDKNRLIKDYDAEFRQQASKLVIDEGMSVTNAAKDLGIPVNTLHGWVRKFRQGIWSLKGETSAPKASSSSANTKLRPPSSSQKQHDRFGELESKNRDLEAKLRRMTMERDVLKKAWLTVWTSRSEARLYPRPSG